MTDDESVQFGKLKAIYPGAKALMEGGKTVVLLPGVTITVGEETCQMNLLLCPFQHSGYPTRLFFESPIEGKRQNWKTLYVAGRNWFAFSWGEVPATMDWPAILCAHLRAVA